MEETFCDACKVHFKGRGHFYQGKHKERINFAVQEDVDAITEIKRSVDSAGGKNPSPELTKYYLHCRYCECPIINRNPIAEAFASNVYH